jgi:hypothetical protein
MLGTACLAAVRSLWAAIAVAGYGRVGEDLSSAARARIGSCAAILPVKVPVLAVPAQLIGVAPCGEGAGAGLRYRLVRR